MEYKNIVLKIEDNIALLTVNRPKALNALNSEVLSELECALYEIENNDDVKCVIITGDGEKAFVAGADIKEMLGMDAIAAAEFAKKGHSIIRFIRKMKKPVIAAVNGYALGGGFELALACDIIYASENAKLGFPEVTLGIMPGFGGTQNLVRICGEKIANELIFTGQMISAVRAKEINVVCEVLKDKESLMDRAFETAKKIASNSPKGVAFAKSAILTGVNMNLSEALDYESTLFGLLFNTEDQKEGMSAFVEKRKAKFKGK
ncbi:enoyl-CoA hydratase/isomerase family protein [Deferribacter autotrophicus]|uniref:Enoyl-CoA hydratase/isomerase family protein n=1 Tax=Deferribacter autotrophicus TaxID=500465 RepID=A0A5A8F8N8_9BACT|nr:enoyl-CoA hydratase-related protein [Deferribacter autotrophicus]KAA0259031.1 enoyl-CoA hydratase/isomerase family protein [Deferribacter autotrophicus]